MSLLVRTPNWLGDAVMSLPSLNGILSRFPDAGLWAHSRVEELYRMVFGEGRVFQFPDLPRNHSFSSLLLMPRSFSSALAGAKAGFKTITGTPGDGRISLLTDVRRIPEDRKRHHSLYYDALAELVEAEPVPPDPPALSRSGQGHIAVFAGARYGDAKVWKGFGQTTALLDHRCIFYGTPNEREYLEQLVEGTDARVVTGLSIMELASSLLSAHAALGNDSGGIHLSAFLGVPSAAVFGSTSPAWTAPMGRKVAIITGDAPCSPCFMRTCKYGIPPCLEQIDPASVAQVVKGLING